MQNKNILEILKWPLSLIVIFLTLGGLGSWFIFWKVDKEEEKLDLAKENYRLTALQIRSIDEIKKNHDSSQYLKTELDKMTLNQANTLDLIEELEKVAVSLGLTLKTSVGENPNSSSGNIKNLQDKTVKAGSNQDSNKKNEDQVWLDLETEGRFNDIRKFVFYLENSQKLVLIASLSLSQGQVLLPEEVFKDPTNNFSNEDLKVEILITNQFN